MEYKQECPVCGYDFSDWKNKNSFKLCPNCKKGSVSPPTVSQWNGDTAWDYENSMPMEHEPEEVKILYRKYRELHGIKNEWDDMPEFYDLEEE